MADSIAKTFRALTTTSNPHAGELLTAALDVPYPAIQIGAIESMVHRGGVREQMEAIRRYPRFAPPIRQNLENSAGSLVPAIRQCLVVGRGDWETAALALARRGEAYGMIEILLDVLRGDRTDLHEEAVQTLRHLVNRLYDHLHGHRPKDEERLKNAPQIQQITLKSLEKALESFGSLTYPEAVVESLLALGGAGHAAPRDLLNKTSPACRSLAKDLLMTSRHPGVMRFLLDSLSRTYPHARILDALQNREDPEFMLATLRWVPKRWTTTQERNLRQIERIAWLKRGERSLESIPEDLQLALMTYVSATGLNREEKSDIRQWVVRHGCPEARSAAVEVLKELDTETVREIVLDGLDSDDPEVQAWATGQLRSQHVPDALQKLIDQLDSPVANVQEVARQELHGFDLACLLSRFEAMSPRARDNAGRLLEKIDPAFLDKLVQEFHHPIRRRRLRAIRASLAFGWHVRVLPALHAMLEDKDNLIRRATIEVLGQIQTGETIALLTEMKNDPSERVRDAARQALAELSPNESPESPPEQSPNP